jgi:hypothetical protein
MSAIKKQLPIIDAHFWIERDGKIIDPDYPDHQYVIQANKCTNKKMYKEAPPSTQEKAIKMYEEYFELVAGKDWLKLMASSAEGRGHYNQCVQVAILERHLRGGRLVFGSMGWEKKKGGVHWEFGGEDWTTLNDFLKVVKRCERCFDEEVSGCPCGHARYCSKECQVADWKTHKLICRTVKKK